MKKQKIKVEGAEIRLFEYDKKDYISLTDIAKQSDSEPRFVIRNWLTTKNTIQYLSVWESLHNPKLNRAGLRTVKEAFFENSFSLTPSKWIKATDAVGLISKAGRGGGTFAHKDIALNFCYWLSPEFQVYFIKEFQRLKEEESSQKNLEWHIKKITDNIDDVRNLLDSVPGQAENRKRIK